MQRRKPVGTATSAAPSSGTSVQPRRRAARAGYSAVRSGDEVKIALSTSPGSKPLASRSAASSSSVASRIASLVFAVAVVAPRRPRRILVMALADQLRLMVITDPVLLRGRDAVAVCRAAAQGGATLIQVRWKDGSPDEVLELTRAPGLGRRPAHGPAPAPSPRLLARHLRRHARGGRAGGSVSRRLLERRSLLRDAHEARRWTAAGSRGLRGA